MRALLLLLVVAVPARAATGSRPFPVGVTTRTVVDNARTRSLVTEVWYPAEDAGRDTAIRRGRYPLVLVAHGFCGFRTNYEYLTVALAGRGFLVAAPDLPGYVRGACQGVGQDAENDLRFLAAAFHTESGPARGFDTFVRGRWTGLVGHSLGTVFVLRAALHAATPAPAVLLAPPAAFSARDFVGIHRRPVLVMGGGADRTVPLPGVLRLFDLLPPPAVLIEIANGTHSGFTDVDAGLGAAALARQQALVTRYATAFLLRYVRRERRFARVLRPADAARQGDDVTLVARLRAP